MQNRWGPSRVGPFGLLQPLADGAKFLLKEDLTPPYVEKHIYLLAPCLSLIMALTSIAMVPIGPIVHLFGISYSDSDHRRSGRRRTRQRHQRRDSHHPRHHLARRLWDCSSGLVVQQQVLAAGLAARLGTDGQLRSFAWPLAGWRAAHVEHPQPYAASSTRSSARGTDSFRSGTSSAASSSHSSFT